MPLTHLNVWVLQVFIEADTQLSCLSCQNSFRQKLAKGLMLQMAIRTKEWVLFQEGMQRYSDLKKGSKCWIIYLKYVQTYVGTSSLEDSSSLRSVSPFVRHAQNAYGAFAYHCIGWGCKCKEEFSPWSWSSSNPSLSSSWVKECKDENVCTYVMYAYFETERAKKGLVVVALKRNQFEMEIFFEFFRNFFVDDAIF